jgi:hypothetical protein
MGSCEHGNEHSSSIKGRKFLDHLIDHYFSKEDSVEEFGWLDIVCMVNLPYRQSDLPKKNIFAIFPLYTSKYMFFTP